MSYEHTLKNPDFRDIEFGMRVLRKFCELMDIPEELLRVDGSCWLVRLDSLPNKDWEFLESEWTYLFRCAPTHALDYRCLDTNLSAGTVVEDLLGNNFKLSKKYPQSYLFSWGRDDKTGEFLVKDQFTDTWHNDMSAETVAEIAAERQQAMGALYGRLVANLTKFRKKMELTVEKAFYKENNV